MTDLSISTNFVESAIIDEPREIGLLRQAIEPLIDPESPLTYGMVSDHGRNVSNVIFETRSAKEPNRTTKKASAETVSARPPRPAGVKATKASSKIASSTETTQKRLAEATLKLANANQKRAQALEEANNYTLFSFRLSDLDADAQEYFSYVAQQFFPA
ncbi:hypothetical protein PC112_g10658 [Phytophthora cactorum]|nr:hypothetical protein PC112_g10658 [Phytophthora cactorum]